MTILYVLDYFLDIFTCYFSHPRIECVLATVFIADCFISFLQAQSSCLIFIPYYVIDIVDFPNEAISLLLLLYVFRAYR
jgi:hypothetical protein